MGSESVRAGAPPPMPQAFFGFATALMGIAFYLLIEVNITIQRFFKRRSGLYYWSLLIASFGTCIHNIAFIIQWWVPGSSWILSAALGQFGWSFMVTAQSLVLYSRLHLVIRNHNILRGVLIMIITTSIAVEVPNWVTSWFAYDTDYKVTKLWTPRDDIMLRISQLVIFLQESTLSILYIWGTVKVLTPNARINVNRIKWDLIAINSFIIATDLVNVILTYANEHYAKEPIQNFSYAFKLRIEFVVLNQLMQVTSQSRASNYNGGNRYIKDGGLVSSNFSSGGGGRPGVTKSSEHKSKASSGDDYTSTTSPTSSRPPHKSTAGLATLAYSPKVHMKSIGSQESGSMSSGKPETSSYELEKLPRAKLEQPSEYVDEGISSVRHAVDRHQEENGYYGEGSPQYSQTERVPLNEETWWDRVLRKVDPSEEERWRRDLSRI